MRFPGGGLLSSPKPAPAPEPPPIPKPVVAPDPDDKQAKLASRRKFAETRLRSGRASTINTPVRTQKLGSGGTGSNTGTA